MNPTAEDLIADYFKKLGYPAIKECNPVMLTKHGDVYLVKFEKKKIERQYNPVNSADSIGLPCPPESASIAGPPYPENSTAMPVKLVKEIPFPNAYAIVIGDVVSGYGEDFWSNADKYRLVLKQHLGMLAMEAAEKVPEKPAPVAVQPDAPPGTVKTETMDAVVARYEEMLQAEADRWTAYNAAAEKQLVADAVKIAEFERRLSMIQKVVNGEPVLVLAPAMPPSPVAEMLNQDDEPNAGLGDWTPEKDPTFHLEKDNLGTCEVAEQDVAGIPYTDHNAAYPRQVTKSA